MSPDAGTALAPVSSLSLWTRQVVSIMALEVRKTIRGKRFWGGLLLALAPVSLFLVQFLVEVSGIQHEPRSLGSLSVILAVVYRTFMLRLVFFFGCVVIFSSLFRGEMLENTFHYYLLSPIRREVLVIAKFLSGLVIAFVLFGTSTVFSFLLMFMGREDGVRFLSSGPGLSHLAGYLGVTLLACVGYGAVFLYMGIRYRNPIVPAAVVMGWEMINFLMPPSLKMISVIYYLESLCPVSIPLGPFTVLADPAPAWLAVPGLLIVMAGVLVLSALRLRRQEIHYSAD